jgi:hypothetical protein
MAHTDSETKGCVERKPLISYIVIMTHSTANVANIRMTQVPSRLNKRRPLKVSYDGELAYIV